MTRNCSFNMNKHILYNDILDNIMKQMIEADTGMTDEEYDRK